MLGIHKISAEKEILYADGKITYNEGWKFRIGDVFMKCMFCGGDESRVIDSRPVEEGHAIRRRRECVRCQKRFTTYETIETTPAMVVKKDGRREPFDPEKIRRGVLKACEKRPISITDVDALVHEVEMQVVNSMEDEITSESIGEMVMQKLRSMDEVAYVRFASVYRQFRDINTFLDELKGLLGDRKAPSGQGRESNAE